MSLKEHKIEYYEYADDIDRCCVDWAETVETIERIKIRIRKIKPAIAQNVFEIIDEEIYGNE